MAIGTLILQHTPHEWQTANLEIVLERVELSGLAKILSFLDICRRRLNHEPQVGFAAWVEKRQVNTTGIPILLQLFRRARAQNSARRLSTRRSSFHR